MYLEPSIVLHVKRCPVSMVFDVQSHPVALCVSLALVSIYALRTIKSRQTGKLPPRPKGIPFFGNLFQLSMMPWKQFEVWKKQYGTSTSQFSVLLKADSVLNTGPLVYLTVAGQGILVLNTHQVAADYWTVEDTFIAIDLV